jgi:alpha-L-rhamnosidase
MAVAAPSVAAASQPLTVDGLTADRQPSPLGLGDARPNLGWRLQGDGRARSQSAYQVIVSGPSGVVWDSGEVHSSASSNVPYGGPALTSGTRYSWKTRVWDESGRPSEWSDAASLETGLLERIDWKGTWIGAPADTLNFSGDRWIWYTNDDAVNSMPAMTRYLRATVTLPAAPAAARLLFTVDDEAAVYVNGAQVIDTKAIRDDDENAWQRAQVVDVRNQLHAGVNTIAVEVKNRLNQNGSPTPAGFIGRLRADGVTLDTGSNWRSAATAPAGWEQPGFDDTAWTPARVLATYGSGPWGGNVSLPPQTNPYLRKDFTTAGEVKSARLYVSALGLYEIRLNGRKVGDQVLAPGWTEYSKRVPSQTYDVTDLVRSGDNVVGAVLGEGWYAGRLQGGRKWGDTPALMAQLRIDYADGSSTRVVTDGTWKAGTGGLRRAGIYDGESYDAQLDQPGWDAPGFSAAGWASAVERSDPPAIEPSQAPPIRVIETLKPVAVTQPVPGTFIYDLGQNFAGWARLRVSGPAGTAVRLRFGEVLNADGTLYRANLRSAQQTDTYTLRGGGEETYEPRFTYHGFRYVEVTGFPGTPTLDSLDGRVVSTDAPAFGTFSSSNALVNQIQSNIRWGQRSNFLAVPTDASQRDERLGWTGDIQAFASTAAYNGDVSGFLGQWLQTLRDSQSSNGAYPDVAPVTCCGEGTAGWGDAGTVVPWALYRHYGDTRVLRDNYDAMKRWIAYLQSNSNGLIRPNAGYGDWLATADTPLDLIATAFFAYSTDIVRRTALVLGDDAGAASYASLYAQIKQAFISRWVHADDTVGSGSQASYVLALKFGLVPDARRAGVFARLVADVTGRGNHLSTGFLGTPFLLSVLRDGGRSDVAYRVLEQDSYPSWGYMIGRGATTIWERWDGIRPDGTLQDAGMNSFNHYGLGSIGDFLYDSVGGMAPDDSAPGYRRIVVKPVEGPGVDGASSTVRTTYGTAATAWKRDANGRLKIDVTVPVGATAEVHVPLADGQQVLESGMPAASQSGVTSRGTSNGDAVYETGSGSYSFAPAVLTSTDTPAGVSGTVPGTLALAVGGPASLGTFMPGVAHDYTTTLSATVTSTAADAALSIHDPSDSAVGRLVNGGQALAQPLQAKAGSGAFAPVGGASSPTPLASWAGPVSNDAVEIGFKQAIGANEGLRTGTYGKTLVLTLSTTAP